MVIRALNYDSKSHLHVRSIRVLGSCTEITSSSKEEEEEEVDCLDTPIGNTSRALAGTGNYRDK